MKRFGFPGALLAVLCLVSFSAVQGEIITIGLEARVESVADDDGLLGGALSSGDIISGWYVYDTSVPDSNPYGVSVGVYDYDSGPSGISLSGGGMVFETDWENVDIIFEVLNDNPFFLDDVNNDEYKLRSFANKTLDSGVSVDEILLQLRDEDGSAISSIELPLAAPVLEDWETGQLLRISGGEQCGCSYVGYMINAEVTSIYMIVPEPATLILLGAAGIFLRRAR